jgi:SPP1 family phage portal protein
VTHPDEAVNEAIQTFCRDSEITDHEAEMVKRCCIYGHAFEYIYQNENAETKVTAYSPRWMFVVYDDTVEGRALFSVRYGYHKSETGQHGAKYGAILTSDLIEPFDNGKKLESQDNPYGRIPCVEWRLNDERMGLYESVAGLVESYNHAIGEKANDVDAFAEAYLAVLGAEVDDDGVRRIRDNRIINLYGTDNAKDVLVQFLTKPTADATQENLLDRLENLIYQTSMVANISDESFGNATSGTALGYKLLAMGNMAKAFDRKIEKSLRKRYKLWSSLSTNTSDPNAWRDMQFQMTRNIPKNVSEETQTAAKAEGLVSKRTQLGLLSYVPDPDAEMERMEQEATAREESVVDRRMFSGVAEKGPTSYQVTSILDKYRAGRLSRQNAVAILRLSGMSDDDAQAYINNEAPEKSESVSG